MQSLPSAFLFIYLFLQLQFSAERLKIVATKMINSVARMKRDGRTAAVAVLREMNFSKESNHHVANMIRQHNVLTDKVAKLDKDPESVSVMTFWERGIPKGEGEWAALQVCNIILIYLSGKNIVVKGIIFLREGNCLVSFSKTTMFPSACWCLCQTTYTMCMFCHCSMCSAHFSDTLL